MTSYDKKTNVKVLRNQVYNPLLRKNATLTKLLQNLLQDLATECIIIDKLLQELARYV